MKIKQKKCKGTGLAVGYGCNTLTFYRKYGLCKSNCYPEWLLNSENGKILVSKTINKVSKNRVELTKLKKDKEERQKLGVILNRIKKKCHKYIRLRDKGKPCVTCNTFYKSDFDAGHCYKAELYNSLKFNEYNIHGQCIKCNRRNEGEVQKYLLNLPLRIGEEKALKLKQIALNEKHQGYKWCRIKLKEIEEYYNKKLKEYEERY